MGVGGSSVQGPCYPPKGPQLDLILRLAVFQPHQHAFSHRTSTPICSCFGVTQERRLLAKKAFNKGRPLRYPTAPQPVTGLIGLLGPFLELRSMRDPRREGLIQQKLQPAARAAPPHADCKTARSAWGINGRGAGACETASSDSGKPCRKTFRFGRSLFQHAAKSAYYIQRFLHGAACREPTNCWHVCYTFVVLHFSIQLSWRTVETTVSNPEGGALDMALISVHKSNPSSGAPSQRLGPLLQGRVSARSWAYRCRPKASSQLIWCFHPAILYTA